MNVLQKNELKNGYYYSGYILQTNSFILTNQQMIVAMWDSKNQCFCMWEHDGYVKCKTKVAYLSDLDNEIEVGFYPIKQTIPKEDQVIE
jgi:hypothetical protein